MYCMYGWEFLEHTYFYHVTRKDVRHNFSVYFYMLYLGIDSWQNLLCFVNQILLILCISFNTYRNLVFSVFMLTYTFVTFNKVATSQYFIWYISYIPLLVPFLSNITTTESVIMTSMWALGQSGWLLFGYYLEFQGLNLNWWVSKLELNLRGFHGLN